MKLKAEYTFPGKHKDEPLICNLCKQFNITLSIVEASFSTDTGWAIFVMEAEEPEINRALEYLKEKGVEIENVQKS